MNFNIIQWRSLKTKMTLFTLAIFLISIWSLAFYASRMLHKDMERLLSDQEFSTVSFIAEEVNEGLNNRLSAMETVAGKISPAILGNTLSLQAFLEDRLVLQGAFNGGIIALGLDGTAIAEIPLSAGRIGVNYMDRDFMAAVLKEGKATIGQPVMGKKLLAPVFVIATPIRDAQGRVMGALMGVTNLGMPNFLNKIAEGHYGKTGGYLLVAPQHRLVVAATDKSRIMETLPAIGINPLVDRIIQGYEGSGVLVNPSGVEELVSAKGVPVAGWYVVVTLPTAEAFAPIHAMQQRILLVTILMTLLMGSLTWWILRRLLFPMLVAARTLAALSNTNQPSQPLPITSQDEIGELIGGFNRLLGNLSQREETLKESEGKYRNLITNSPDAILITQQDSVTLVNDTCLRLFGAQSESELIGKSSYDLFHPEFHNRIKKRIDRLRDKGEPVSPIEGKIVRFDGSVVDVEVLVAPFLYGGMNNTHVIIRDITERKWAGAALKESEEKYRSMMEAMDDATYICSSDFRITYQNPVMIERVARDATGELCYKGMYGRDEKCPWCIHEKVMRGEYLKTEVVSPNNGKTYHISNAPIYHADGSVSKLSIFRDITETKKMAERLDQAQRMEAIGALAGGIAHDFNNILYPIIGFSEMLMEDLPAGSPNHENAGVIFTAAKRAGDLVKQILSFSRQAEHKKIPVRIQHILKEVLKLTRSTIPSNIDITQSIQSDCGLVMADPTQLHQIAMNLITNAYHAVEESGGRISIQLKDLVLTGEDWEGASLEPGKYAVLSVTDNGYGIDPANIRKIFEPFYTTKKLGKGTGLGLSVVYGIIKDHDGDVRVYSEVGKGTTFSVYLPIIKKDTETESSEALVIYETGTERILLVDDEASIVQLEKQMLERLGYHVEERTSSIEALKAFRANPKAFDLVITDMNMPNMTGDKLTAELRSIQPGIPVIICTGFSVKIDEQRAKVMGVNGCLMKPIVKSEIAQMVRKVLDEAERKNEQQK